MSTFTCAPFHPAVTWPFPGTTATLRLQYSAEFVDSANNVIVREFYKSVTCSISGGVITVPQFTLVTTNDALVNTLATCSARFYDQSGAPRAWLFQNFVIPQSLAVDGNGDPVTSSMGALMAYNARGAIISLARDTTLTRSEITSLIAAMLTSLGVTPATDIALGTVRLSTAAADPADPEVWGTNDPRVRDATKIQGTLVDDDPPADLNVLQYSAISGLADWAALALRGVTPNTRTVSAKDQGTSDDDVMFLDPTSNPDFNFTFPSCSTRTTPFTVRNIATNANASNLFPDTGDMLEDADDATPTPLPAGDMRTYFPRTSTIWARIY
ncbi:MAG: hypothetical protein ABR555_12560 [Pyrinomonadaceae bacterium]